MAASNTSGQIGSRVLNINLQGNPNFQMYQGETKNLSMPITDDNGKPLDLTGCTINWGLRQRMTSTVNLIIKSTPNDISVSGNNLTVHLLPSDTASLKGAFFHECKMMDESGEVSVLFTGNAMFFFSNLTISPPGKVVNPPADVTNLTVGSIAETSLTLSWTASPTATSYDVYVGSAFYANVSATSCNITGLTAGTTYSFEVMAVNTGGSSHGVTVSGTTLSTTTTSTTAVVGSATVGTTTVA